MWKWYGKHIFITDVGKHNCIMNYLTNEIPFVSVGDRWKPIRVSSHKPSQNSLTFPDHFVFSPNQETCYRYYYCLNNNVASNLTNHSPKLPIYKVITIRQNVKNMKFYISNFHKTVHSDNHQNWITWREELLRDFILFSLLSYIVLNVYSLTLHNIIFFPGCQHTSLTFARSGISLAFPWQLDTLSIV